MELHSEHPAEEIKRLRRCINDLVSVLALPAVWSGGEPSQVVRTLLDVLLGMLRLDFVYVRLKDPAGGAPIEIVRVAQSRRPTVQPQEIGELLQDSLGPDSQKWAARIRNPVGDGDISIVPLRLGLQSEIGAIVAGSQRADFPSETERLLLSVAANQAAIGLQEARLLSEQKRVANELDQRVAQRTIEFAAANEELKTQIAERKRAEEALWVSERNLSLIINTIPTLAWSARPDGSAEFFNQHYLDYVGLSSEQAQHWGWTVAVHPDDLSVLAASWRATMASGKAGESEARLRRFDGEYRSFLFRANPLRDESGGIVKWFGTNTDIEDRKRAEDALRASERNLHQMRETIPEMLWSATPEGSIDYCNTRLLDYTGLRAEEVRGDGWTKLLHPRDVEQATRTWISCATSGAPYRVEVRTIHAADRTYRWCMTSALPLLDQQGRILKWYGTVVDMHDWKQGKVALRQSEQRYRHLFHNMPVALWRVDTSGLTELLEGVRTEGVADLSGYMVQHPDFMLRAMNATKILEANESAVQMFGTRQASEMTQSGTRYWQESPGTYRRILETRFRGEETFQEETKVVTLDGRVIDVLVTVARLGLSGNPGITIIGFIDISEHIRAREMLQQVQAEFAHGARVSMLGELTASIAHEVNQPLAAIQTNGGTGLRWLERSEPNVAKARELMQRILDDARRASNIVARIRTMAAGRAPQQTALALRDVITESMLFLRHEFQSKEVSATLDLAPALPQVVGDRTQLQQVIVNLAMNAVQAMAQSGGTPRGILIRTMLSAPETVCCTIEDSGPGIDPTHLPHVFDSFFTTKDTGVGMGLAISRSIIEAHCGHIRADNDSALGGARFSFALPANGASTG